MGARGPSPQCVGVGVEQAAWPLVLKAECKYESDYEYSTLQGMLCRHALQAGACEVRQAKADLAYLSQAKPCHPCHAMPPTLPYAHSSRSLGGLTVVLCRLCCVVRSAPMLRLLRAPRKDLFH